MQTPTSREPGTQLQRPSSLARRIELLLASHESAPLTIGELVLQLAHRGPTMLVAILSLPYVQPLTVPFVTIPFSIVIGLLGLTIALGKPIKIPDSLARKQIHPKLLHTILSRFGALARRLDRWMRPRLLRLVRNRSLRFVSGIYITFLAVFLALPLPIPFSNMVCALPIFLMALGLLQRDGLFVLASYIAFVPFAAFFGALLLLGDAALRTWMH
jgi:hypothetical protein